MTQSLFGELSAAFDARSKEFPNQTARQTFVAIAKDRVPEEELEKLFLAFEDGRLRAVIGRFEKRGLKHWMDGYDHY